MPDNERTQKSSGGETVMNLMEGGIQGLYLGQRTIKSPWKVAPQALKSKETG